MISKKLGMRANLCVVDHNGRVASYTSYNKPSSITQGNLR
jgi:hypothetical protein